MLLLRLLREAPTEALGEVSHERARRSFDVHDAARRTRHRRCNTPPEHTSSAFCALSWPAYLVLDAAWGSGYRRLLVVSRAFATDLDDYDGRALAETVSAVIDAVRRRGDDAVRSAAGTSGADNSLPLALQAHEIESSLDAIPGSALDDMRLVQLRTRRFAEAQRVAIIDFETEVGTGVRVGVRHAPASSVGICLPDRATDGLVLSAVQVAAITAQAAGVERVVACIPGRPDDPPSPLLIAALATAGLTEIYRAAGVHGFAALSFGTESIPASSELSDLATQPSTRPSDGYKRPAMPTDSGS